MGLCRYASCTAIFWRDGVKDMNTFSSMLSRNYYSKVIKYKVCKLDPGVIYGAAPLLTIWEKKTDVRWHKSEENQFCP